MALKRRTVYFLVVFALAQFVVILLLLTTNYPPSANTAQPLSEMEEDDIGFAVPVLTVVDSFADDSISVIVPVVAEHHNPMRVLDAIEQHCAMTNAEIIVVTASPAFTDGVDMSRHTIIVNASVSTVNEALDYGSALASGSLLLFLSPLVTPQEDIIGKLRQTLTHPEVAAAGCTITTTDEEGTDVIVNHGFRAALGTDDDPVVFPLYEGLHALDSRVKSRSAVLGISQSCLMVRSSIFSHVGGFVTRYSRRRPRRSVLSGVALDSTNSFDVSGIDLCMRVHQYNVSLLTVASSAAVAQHPNFVPRTPSTLQRELVDTWKARLLARIFKSHTLKNLNLFYDVYCSCTGVNIEAINFLFPLEKHLPIKAIGKPDCWCPGFPPAYKQALQRMASHKPFMIDRMTNFGTKFPQFVSNRSTVWISHKPPDAYPQFPYDGTIYHRNRPNYVIGRSMIEVSSIRADWVTACNGGLVNEVWVPSKFMYDVFSDSGVNKSKLFIVPEAIDTDFYNPATVSPLPWIVTPRNKHYNNFKFLSTFKWEDRKGWDVLLRAYFQEFTSKDPVSLYFKTFLYMDYDAHNSKKIEKIIENFAMRELSLKPENLPHFRVIAQDIPERDMPRLYAR
eukprot:TRINITY_DN20356_c0_g2_i1.p1 TRINITY_DN20356_c0_g2~~TRINITY_DN20356_c0_g2_i1.p1  ORF type:complete len:619 (-),score=83.73 TRINITY_DN20356_c0_g2_i1:418-2274(-)